jgi:hypothetical protein
MNSAHKPADAILKPNTKAPAKSIGPLKKPGEHVQETMLRGLA